MKNLRPQIQLSNGEAGFRATLAAEIRILDQSSGIVEYVASDETIDSYKEIVRADGWKFTLFEKNAPFVDTHQYWSIEHKLGNVIDWRVDKRKRQLIETVQWAKEVKSNRLAQLGWDMIVAGFGHKAVSVGFYPTRYASKWDSDRTHWLQQLEALGVHEETGVRVIYVEQEQIELSACVLGANPNALQLTAKAFKAGVLKEGDLEFLAQQYERREMPEPTPTEPAPATKDSALVAWAEARTAKAFLDQLETKIKTL
jgi:hypothetical protein